MTPDEMRSEAKRLLKDITPGEWTVAPCSDTDQTRDVVADFKEVEQDGRTIKQADWIAELSGDFDFDTDEEAEYQKIEANALFIAAAPRLIRSLLALVEEQETAITKLRRARIGDSEIIGRWQCQAEKAEAERDALQAALAAANKSANDRLKD